MSQLKELRQRLQNTGLSKDRITVINLCEVMQIVGGYTQLLELPLPAVDEILWYLEWKSKAEQKSGKRLKK